MQNLKNLLYVLAGGAVVALVLMVGMMPERDEFGEYASFIEYWF